MAEVKKSSESDQDHTKTALCEYLTSMQREWATHRKDKEIEWEQNLNAFLAISDNTWKDKDTKKKKKGDEWRSDVFVRLTKVKVVMAAALICDMLFQGAGDLPFNLEVIKEEYEEEEVELAEEAAKEMAETIRGQMQLAKVDRAFKKSILSMPLYGGGWLKDNFETVERSGWRKNVPEGYPEHGSYEKYEEEEEIPSEEYLSVWDMFPDPESDDEQSSRGNFERRMVSPFDLRKLMDEPGYDKEAIEEVIERNASKSATADDTSTLSPLLRNVANRRRGIKYLEFWGRVPINLLKTFDAELSTDEDRETKGLLNTFDYEISDDTGEEVEAKIGIADDTIICMVANEGGRRPYHYAPYERILDSFHGIGTADNLRDSQTMVNSAVNAFADNKALSGNVVLGVIASQLAGKQSSKLKPGKVFKFNEGTNIQQAMQGIVIPDVGESLLSLVHLFERYGDEESQLPKIMQGEVAEKRKADTLGEMQILQSNAGKYMGQVMRNIDDELIEPIVMRYYDHNMMQGVNAEILGAFKARALGFSSYQNKVILAGAYMKFMQLATTHDAILEEVDVREILEQVGKAMDLDPKQVLLSEEEKMERSQGMQQAEEEAIESQVETEDKVGDDQLERDMVLEHEKSENKKEEILVKGAIELDKERIKAAVQEKKAKEAAKKPAVKPKPKKKAA